MDSAEKIARKIVETVEANEALAQVAVQRDAQVEGRTGSYPVDVYLEFQGDNGIRYKILIDTQNAGRPLEKNALFQFASVLQDISGQVMGVMFTQPVYDKLVQDVARDVGILLYEVRNLADRPVWEPEISQVRVEVDRAWVKAEKEKHGLGDAQLQSGGNPKYMYLYDEAGNCVDTVEGVFQTYVRRQSPDANAGPMQICHAFDSATYLETKHEIIRRVKLQEISFTLSFRNVMALDGDEIVQKILRAALAAELK